MTDEMFQEFKTRIELQSELIFGDHYDSLKDDADEKCKDLIELYGEKGLENVSFRNKSLKVDEFEKLVFIYTSLSYFPDMEPYKSHMETLAPLDKLKGEFPPIEEQCHFLNKFWQEIVDRGIKIFIPMNVIFRAEYFYRLFKYLDLFSRQLEYIDNGWDIVEKYRQLKRRKKLDDSLEWFYTETMDH